MRTASTTIVRRQVDIDFDPVPPGPWFPAGGPLETMFNAASLSFPPTERFFIAAVRAYEDKVTDPVLRDQMRDFVYQEAMHNKVHVACNSMLARGNSNCRRAERVSVATFAVLGKLPRVFRLSLSSALEHFTAMAADTLLHYPEEFSNIVPPEVARMWLWHAAEEIEHKAVCFDVHEAIAGRGVFAYVNRLCGMLFATPLFLFVLLLITAAALSSGRRPKAAAHVAAPLQASNAAESDADRFMGRGMFGLLYELVPWRLYFSYYRPSFHPWHHDNARFVEDWKQRYPGFGLG